MPEKLPFIPPAEIGVTREPNFGFPVNLLLRRSEPSGFRGIDWALGRQQELVRGNQELAQVIDFAQTNGTKVIAVSPHPDDLPFSIGGLLPHFPPENLWSLTLFTRADGSPFANTPNRARFLSGDFPTVEALNEERAEEDLQSNEILGVLRAHQRQLGFIDGPWRTLSYDPTHQIYPSISFSLGRIAIDDEFVLMPQITEQLREEVHDIVGDSQNFLIFAPAALGLGVPAIQLRHVDHMITRDAVMAAFPSTLEQDNVIFYGEYPYLNEARPDRRLLSANLLPALVGVTDQQRKRDAILAHKSQVGRMFDQNTLSHGELPDTLPPEMFLLSANVLPTITEGSRRSFEV